MTTWIFLRGLTRESRHWGEFPDVFRRHIPDAQIVSLELPGNGTANALQSPSAVPAMAEYCRAELARRGIDPPYRVLAMSLGAMVAVAWAQRYPREIEAGVLINTSMRPFNPLHQRLRPRALATLLSILLRKQTALEREAAILRLTTRHLLAAEKLIGEWAGYRRSHPVSAGNAFRQLLAAARFCAASGKPETRLLILCSVADALVDPRCSRRIAREWLCESAEHPSAGHDIPVDDGEWVAKQVRDWLVGQ